MPYFTRLTAMFANAHLSTSQLSATHFDPILVPSGLIVAVEPLDQGLVKSKVSLYCQLPGRDTDILYCRETPEQIEVQIEPDPGRRDDIVKLAAVNTVRGLLENPDLTPTERESLESCLKTMQEQGYGG